MPNTPPMDDAHGYLVVSRAEVVSCLDGLDEYAVRRPMTPTGTSLLGVVKHLIGIEAGYLGRCLGRPFPESLPWTMEGAEPNDDMWAGAEESRAGLLEQYGRACAHADANLAELGPEAPAQVPWWPAECRVTTAGALLNRVLKDTASHAGQLQVLRELIDGRGGRDQDQLGDEAWWSAYVDRLEYIAQRFRSTRA